MPRIASAPPDRYAEVADHMTRWTRQKGYPPNSWQTMLRKPRIFRAYRDLHTAVMIEPGEAPQGLKFLLAAAVSMATGDAYCAAHNAENAAEIGGVDIAKIEALAQFRTSAHYTPAERAALELAHAAGSHPPAVTDAHFETLRAHYSDDAIAEIVAVLALLGWLNRWCMTLAPALEPRAAAFAERHLPKDACGTIAK